jgi:hypothetical protein
MKNCGGVVGREFCSLGESEAVATEINADPERAMEDARRPLEDRGLERLAAESIPSGKAPLKSRIRLVRSRPAAHESWIEGSTFMGLGRSVAQRDVRRSTHVQGNGAKRSRACVRRAPSSISETTISRRWHEDERATEDRIADIRPAASRRFDRGIRALSAAEAPPHHLPPSSVTEASSELRARHLNRVRLSVARRGRRLRHRSPQAGESEPVLRFESSF